MTKSTLLTLWFECSILYIDVLFEMHCLFDLFCKIRTSPRDRKLLRTSSYYMLEKGTCTSNSYVTLLLVYFYEPHTNACRLYMTMSRRLACKGVI